MKKDSKSVAQLYKSVSLVIYHLIDEELQKRMSAYGFTPKRVKEGKDLFEIATLMDDTQDQHYNQARRISYQIEQDNETAQEVFRDHVAIAKSAFRKEPLVIQELKITRVSSKTWIWTMQAMVFYAKASMYMERLQQFGATQEAFDQNRAAVEALLELDMQRIKKKGEAENSTQEKDQAIKDLRAWYGEFRKLARMAFRDKPQMLEIFGIAVPSSNSNRAGKKRKDASATAPSQAEATQEKQ